MTNTILLIEFSKMNSIPAVLNWGTAKLRHLVGSGANDFIDFVGSFSWNFELSYDY